MIKIMRIGYTLSSEERTARELIDLSAQAEKAGFDFVGISDHFHPWADSQGQSPFVWTTLGGIAEVTKKIEVLIEVTCPILRYHPAIIAQATATVATLLENRFTFGVGTGEKLNEHVVGAGWPIAAVRRAMLCEAVDIIQELWQGKITNYDGEFYTVESAQLYSLPEKLPPLIVSAFGPKGARLAGEIGDGFISIAPNKELIDEFETHGGEGKPKYGQIDVCYGEDKQSALETAFQYWPNKAAPSDLSTELKMPYQYEAIAEEIGEEKAIQNTPLGDNIEEFVGGVQAYLDAGYDNLYFHQIGPDQAGFFKFFTTKLQPALNNM